MKLSRLTKFLIAAALAAVIAVPVLARTTFEEQDDGDFCFRFANPDALDASLWCWNPEGFADVTAVADANSATTNDTFEIAFTSPVDTTGTNTHNAITIDLGIGNATGGTNTVTALQIDAISGDAQVTTNAINIGAMTGTGATENAITIGTGWDAAISSGSGLTLDDGTTDSPSLVFQDATDETVTVAKVDAGSLDVTSSASGTNDGLRVMTGSLFVGNGTPGETINGEDFYVEGLSEFDGTANFDGTADFDGAFILDSTTIAEEPLKFAARGFFEICGDTVTVNANSVYYGPSQAVASSATVGQVTCNTTAAGNATEATADEPVLTNTAIYPLGMVCYTTDIGATGSPATFALRSAGAAITPPISMSIADNELSGTASATATTAIAAGAAVAVEVTSAADLGSANFICRVSYAY